MESKQFSFQDYYLISVDEVIKKFRTSDKGLSSHEAELRLHQHGFNELIEKKEVHPFKVLLRQFVSPLVWILIAAITISFFLKEYTNSIVIAVIIILNMILGFTQEFKAERAIAALKKLSSPKAKVIRDGREIIIESRVLVPGDVLLVENGDRVTADARIIEAHELQTQEASLTGESHPVEKLAKIIAEKTSLADRKNMLYSSTIIVKGRGKAVVTGTGMKTQVGKIAKLIQESKSEPTPLQNQLNGLGKYLTIAVVIIAMITFLAGILTGKEISLMLLTAIALAVAAIPEGLPAIITISLALGIQKMAKRNALVRKLPSVETLGSVTVICTDKTGTLTHNEMTVTKLWFNQKTYEITGSGYSPTGEFKVNNQVIDPIELLPLLKAGLLCNNSKVADGKRRKIIGDPTEGALLVSAEKAGLKIDNIEASEPRSDEITFSSERKLMTTIHQQGNKKLSYSKGAPEIILERCNRILINGKIQRMDRSHFKEILLHNENFTRQSLRVLGFAYNENFKEAETEMIFLGLQAMIDPPREEVKKAIATCKQAGIRVIMITGDQIGTARAIAQKLGITGESITGKELEEINLNEKISEINIFARVEPGQKLDIVRALKKQGETVAMTGDGINDAPALKKADIGISMGITGTDVAKEASEIILTDDNFTSIVNAIEEGRSIFDNIKKFINYLLSSNLAEIIVVFLGMVILSPIFGTGIPLTAIHILWINLITDGLPAVALSLDPARKDIMDCKPRNPKENILSKQLTKNIITLGSVIGLITLLLFWLYRGSPLVKAQTIVFTSLVVFEIARLQMIRMEYKLSIFSNKYLIGAVFISIGLQLLVIYTPLNKIFNVTPLELLDWFWIILAAILIIIINATIYKLQKIKK